MAGFSSSLILAAASPGIVRLAYLTGGIILAGAALRALKRLAAGLVAGARGAHGTPGAPSAVKSYAAFGVVAVVVGLWSWQRVAGILPPALTKASTAAQPKRQPPLSLAERFLPPKPNAACPTCSEGFALTAELARAPVQCGVCFGVYAQGQTLVTQFLRLQSPLSGVPPSMPAPPRAPRSGDAVLLTPLGKVTPPPKPTRPSRRQPRRLSPPYL